MRRSLAIGHSIPTYRLTPSTFLIFAKRTIKHSAKPPTVTGM